MLSKYDKGVIVLDEDDTPADQTSEVEQQIKESDGEKQKEIKCLKCGKIFTTVKNLKKHVRRFHGPEAYQCEYCDRFFNSDTDLARHRKVHLGYTCEVCNKVRLC